MAKPLHHRDFHGDSRLGHLDNPQHARNTPCRRNHADSIRNPQAALTRLLKGRRQHADLRIRQGVKNKRRLTKTRNNFLSPNIGQENTRRKKYAEPLLHKNSGSQESSAKKETPAYSMQHQTSSLSVHSLSKKKGACEKNRRNIRKIITSDSLLNKKRGYTMNKYTYTNNITKDIVFTCTAADIIAADKEYAIATGANPIKQKHVGCSIEFKKQNN